jgi:hypothetical protein
MALTSLAFLVAFFGCLGYSFLRGPVWGLYAYLAVFYLHPPSRWWGAMLPDMRWSLLAASVTLLTLFLHRERSQQRPPFLSHGLSRIFFAYVVWMWLQIPFVVSNEHLDGVVLFTKYAVLLYLIYRVIDSPDRVRDFLVAHIVGCFYLGWLAYTAEGGGRLEGVGGPGINDANTMSMHLGTGIIIGSMLLMTERGWRFWLIVGAMPFMLNGMMQGNSRGAFVGLIAGGVCLFWLKPSAYRKQFLVFGALGAMLFAYLANDYFIARMSTMEAVASDEAELDFSARSRLVIMRAEWRMFLDYPLGAGHAGTAALSPQYLSREYLTTDASGVTARSSHNTLMSIVVDQGIPGLVLMLMLLHWVWRHVGVVTRRSMRDPRVWGYGSAISAGLCVAIVAGQFAPYLKAEVQYWLLGLVLCLLSPSGLQLNSPTGVPDRSLRSSPRLRNPAQVTSRAQS